MAGIAWLGNWSQPEFFALHREGLAETAPFFSHAFSDLQELTASLQAGTFPDLVLVAQSWSEEFPLAAIDRLIRLSPLTRWICCYGAWCDADGRTRDLWPSGCRVPPWRFLPRLRQELKTLTLSPSTTLPLTASREEIFAQDYEPSSWDGTAKSELRLNSVLGPSVQVDSPDPAYASFLSHACQSFGLRTNAPTPDLVLFDLDPDTETRKQDLARLRDQFPTAQFLGLQGFSNPDQDQSWTSRGITRITSKLTPLSELVDLIENCLPQPIK